MDNNNNNGTNLMSQFDAQDLFQHKLLVNDNLFRVHPPTNGNHTVWYIYRLQLHCMQSVARDDSILWRQAVNVWTPDYMNLFTGWIHEQSMKIVNNFVNDDFEAYKNGWIATTNEQQRLDAEARRPPPPPIISPQQKALNAMYSAMVECAGCHIPQHKSFFDPAMMTQYDSIEDNIREHATRMLCKACAAKNTAAAGSVSISALQFELHLVDA